jgi:hypothetical protein
LAASLRILRRDRDAKAPGDPAKTWYAMASTVSVRQITFCGKKAGFFLYKKQFGGYQQEEEKAIRIETVASAVSA